jgi:hypothetical protein
MAPDIVPPESGKSSDEVPVTLPVKLPVTLPVMSPVTLPLRGPENKFAVTVPEAFAFVAITVPVNVGEVPNTNKPVPVSSVTAEIKFALLGVAKKVATLLARPDTPVDIGNPVPLVRTTADGVPSAGVTRVGLLANTAAPVPVSSVKADARLALDGVARKVATPLPRPSTPVDIGNPVVFVSTPEAGVPSAGATKVL